MGVCPRSAQTTDRRHPAQATLAPPPASNTPTAPPSPPLPTARTCTASARRPTTTKAATDGHPLATRPASLTPCRSVPTTTDTFRVTPPLPRTGDTPARRAAAWTPTSKPGPVTGTGTAGTSRGGSIAVAPVVGSTAGMVTGIDGVGGLERTGEMGGGGGRDGRGYPPALLDERRCAGKGGR